MNIIAVDDNRADLLNLKEAINQAAPNCILSCFTKQKDALNYADAFTIDVAFIDPAMDDGNGSFLAQKLKKKHSCSNIVFVAEDDHWAQYALSLRASGYVRKPITAKMVSAELENLRHPTGGVWRYTDEPYFTIKTADSEITVPFFTINCVEYGKGLMTFHVYTLEPLCVKVLPWRFGKAIAPLLEDERFLKISNKCVINMDCMDETADNQIP